MKTAKKALAIVAGPYRFYQVVWLYTQFTELEWNILLLPYGKGEGVVNNLYSKSEKLGIFNQIYISKMIGQDSDMLSQIWMMLKMCWYYVCGKKKELMRRIIFSQTNQDDFDVFFIGCEYSIIEGAVIGLADEKKVYIFEEGLGDYLPRKKYPTFSIKEIISYIVSKMGYFSPYTFFEMQNLSLCVKYASLPELLYKRRYKEVRKLFKGDAFSNKRYKELLDRIYCVPKGILENSEIVFFTSPWDWNMEKKNYYLEKIKQWLIVQYGDKHIAIKKHPRDQEKYEWSELNFIFLPENIPAEILAEYMRGKVVVMMGVSTTILSLLSNVEKIQIFQFDNIHGEYEKNMLEKIQLLNIENTIIHI